MMRKNEVVVKIPAENPPRNVRERLMFSRAELARKAGVSVLTLGTL
jgi:DNA-binding XRE family transcriptional regulator